MRANAHQSCINPRLPADEERRVILFIDLNFSSKRVSENDAAIEADTELAPPHFDAGAPAG
jgi:hypothetical protein